MKRLTASLFTLLVDLQSCVSSVHQSDSVMPTYICLYTYIYSFADDYKIIECSSMQFSLASCLSVLVYLSLLFVYFIHSSVYLWRFPCGSAGKESACNGGDLGSI